MKLYRLIGLLVFAAVLATFVQVTVAQAKTTIPDVTVHSKEGGVAVTYGLGADWHYYDSDSGWKHIEGDRHGSNWNWPDARVDHGTKLWFKVKSPRKPDMFHLRYYTKVDRNEAPEGEARIMNTSKFYPVRGKDGKVKAWKTYFSLEKPHQNYYLTPRFGYEKDPGTHHSYGTFQPMVQLYSV